MVKLVGLPLLAAIFAVIGFTGLFILPLLLNKLVDRSIVLDAGSKLYPLWRDVPLPVYHEFYFFNITNPEEVEKSGAKPNLQEIGPFTYLVKAYKTVSINPNGTISFRQTKNWFFERSKSAMDETTVINTLNAPLAITLSLFSKLGPHERELIEISLSLLDHGFIIQRTVQELTFQGYKDVLMSLGPLIAPKATAGYNGKFGYFHHKNGTDDGLITVFNGVKDISQINLLHRINGQPSLDVWNSQLDEGSQFDCNQFNDSTLGELFPSPKRHLNSQSLKLFSSDLSRTLTLNHQKSHTPFKGLETWRFIFSPNNFANSSSYPPNQCYSSQQPSHNFDGSNGTLPSGVFDASKPNFGLPLFMSLPHFYGSDPYYISRVDGLSPNETLHSTWLEVEPTSGATAATTFRLQINVGVTDSQLFKKHHQMPNIVFPVLWMQVTTSLTQEIVDLLVVANTILTFVPIIVFSIGVGLSAVTLLIASLRLVISKRQVRIVSCLNIITCHQYKSLKDDEQIIIDTDDLNDNNNSIEA